MPAVFMGRRLSITILLVACGIATVWLTKIFTGKSAYREMYKGNVGAELEVYTAGLNFARHGFAPLYYLPGIARYEESRTALLDHGLYTHFPPGPDIINGLLQRAGLLDFYHQKLAMLAVNLAVVLLLMACARRLWPADGAAPCILAALVVSSVWFLWWAGNLFDRGFNDLFMATGLWLALTKRERWLPAIGFLALCFSFEPIPWLGLVAFFAAVERVRAGEWRWQKAGGFLVVMGGAFFLSFALHIVQNGFYLGSLQAAIDDLLSAYRTRTRGGAGINLYSPAKQIVKGLYACLWYYGTGLLALAAIGLWQSARRRMWWPVVLVGAGLAWPILFRQHSMIHAFTWLHLGIGLFVAATVGFLRLWEQRPWQRGLAIGLAALAILRLPAGCEMSRNPLCLERFRVAIGKTDSATIAQLIYFFKDNPEHAHEKEILVRELITRNHAPTNAAAYTITGGGSSITVARDAPDQKTKDRNFPPGRTPVFRDELYPYLDIASPRMNAGNTEMTGLQVTPVDRGAPVVLQAEGTGDPWRYRVLLAYMLLQ